MSKKIYLIRGEKSENYASFKSRVLETSYKMEKNLQPNALKLTITESAPPKISIIPFKKSKIAVLSVYMKDHSSVNSFLSSVKGFAGAYMVEKEALPVRYDKDWPDKEPTPGVCLVTLFFQKKSIVYKTFIHRWHNGHTPLSLKIHPLWNYNRNVVKVDNAEADIPPYDGIVEENVQKRSDLLNPCKFFGNPFTMLFNMIRVYFDTNSFIEFKTIETYLTKEYHIKSK